MPVSKSVVWLGRWMWRPIKRSAQELKLAYDLLIKGWDFVRHIYMDSKKLDDCLSIYHPPRPLGDNYKAATDALRRCIITMQLSFIPKLNWRSLSLEHAVSVMIGSFTVSGVQPLSYVCSEWITLNELNLENNSVQTMSKLSWFY